MRIVWTRQSVEQLSAMQGFLEGEGAAAASARQVSAVLEAVEHLSSFPELGRSGRVAGTRELVVPGTPYLVAYRVRGGSVRVLSLLHGSRRWPERF